MYASGSCRGEGKLVGSVVAMLRRGRCGRGRRRCALSEVPSTPTALKGAVGFNAALQQRERAACSSVEGEEVVCEGSLSILQVKW